MKLGLISFQNSGKTTLYKSLTSSSESVYKPGKQRLNSDSSLITVSDERIDELTQLYQPKKTSYATIELINFPGFTESVSSSINGWGKTLQQMRSVNGFALVLRNFVDLAGNLPTPEKDLEKIEAEMILCDHVSIEKRFEKFAWFRQRGKMTMELQREEKILKRASDHLDRFEPIRTMPLSPEEEKMIRGFQFLSQKPIMLILNSDEDNFGTNEVLLSKLSKRYNIVEFAGKFELELSQLEDQNDIQLFMDEIGITQSGRIRLTRLAYKTLGMISFFTVGADEVRAWSLKRGDSALDAARAIHADLGRGFIKAHCFSYHDLIHLRSEKKIKEMGLYKLEGKTYTVQDGTIIDIKFNV
ncbi:DUF933 domain-containing protein [candidate division CSSED10-310 bacterium]|uniref:DUF933 domain-containing protein n=1 Tax=candidate division CSSED10-310 bacterium TaxID=2855610 RepID=A0ABV6YUE4_UNCC1